MKNSTLIILGGAAAVGALVYMRRSSSNSGPTVSEKIASALRMPVGADAGVLDVSRDPLGGTRLSVPDATSAASGGRIVKPSVVVTKPKPSTVTKPASVTKPAKPRRTVSAAAAKFK